MPTLAGRTAAVAGDIDIDADFLYVMKGDASAEWKSTPSLVFMPNSTSVRLGTGAGDVIAAGGVDNTCIGVNSGLLISTGDRHTMLGKGAGATMATAADATCVGYNAGNASAVTITAVGSGCLDVSTGANNTGLGFNAGGAVSTGARITCLGDSAGVTISTNNDLTAVGYQAATLATVTATAVGSGALANMTTGTNNSALGYQAGNVATGIEGTFVGAGAGQVKTSGNNCTYLGSNAGIQETTGADNTLVGFSTIGSGSTRAVSRCTAVGSKALQIGTGSDDTALGASCLVLATSGGQNTGVGAFAMQTKTTGARNVAVGYAAINTTLTTGSDNTCLGYNTAVSAAAASFQTAIGSGATCTANNQVMLGRSNEDVLCPGTFSMGATAGGATSSKRILIKKTGIADNTATDIITVTVPNANHAACIKLTLLSSNGSTDAFESSRCAEGMVVLARTTGVATVATVATLELAQIATVAAGATHTLAYGVSAMTGAVGATQTFTIQLTIDDSGNLGSNQAVILAEIVNAEATGVTMAAA